MLSASLTEGLSASLCKGGAPRSESKSSMIAGGNHTTVYAVAQRLRGCQSLRHGKPCHLPLHKGGSGALQPSLVRRCRTHLIYCIFHRGIDNSIGLLLLCRGGKADVQIEGLAVDQLWKVKQQVGQKKRWNESVVNCFSKANADAPKISENSPSNSGKRSVIRRFTLFFSAERF